jgi:hypothetical protein
MSAEVYKTAALTRLHATLSHGSDDFASLRPSKRKSFGNRKRLDQSGQGAENGGLSRNAQAQALCQRRPDERSLVRPRTCVHLSGNHVVGRAAQYTLSILQLVHHGGIT